ncbi:MAG TPA: YciI family protein [Anaeromyxobacteraceae bacterium]|nr:YciI family protein [Anaeromyxobacteraceae bacterium]
MRHVIAAVALAACATVLAVPATSIAGESPGSAAPKHPEGAPFEMESFQLVLLMRAPTWKKLPEPEANTLQSAHLAHLGEMWKLGKAVVCGPFDNQQDPTFRGACIYAVKTPEEARELASKDPTVKAGQLRVEVVTWWVGKGFMAFPKTPHPER